MNTTVFTITVDPFKKWKKTGRMLAEAKAQGFLTLVCLDDRTSAEDRTKIASLADRVIDWTSEGFCEKAYQYVGEVPTKNVLLISDDELPSPMLWTIAKDPPAEARWGIPVIPVVGQRYDRSRVGFQERLFATKGWQWVGGYEGHSEGAPMAIFQPNPGAVVWHYLLEAPREEREEKAKRYASLAPGGHRERLIYEEHDDLVPLSDQLRAFLPPVHN